MIVGSGSVRPDRRAGDSVVARSLYEGFEVQGEERLRMVKSTRVDLDVDAAGTPRAQGGSVCAQAQRRDVRGGRASLARLRCGDEKLLQRLRRRRAYRRSVCGRVSVHARSQHGRCLGYVRRLHVRPRRVLARRVRRPSRLPLRLRSIRALVERPRHRVDRRGRGWAMPSIGSRSVTWWTSSRRCSSISPCSTSPTSASPAVVVFLVSMLLSMRADGEERR